MLFAIFFNTEYYIFISIIPNRHTKFIINIFKNKIEELVKAMKVTEMMITVFSRKIDRHP